MDNEWEPTLQPDRATTQANYITIGVRDYPTRTRFVDCPKWTYLDQRAAAAPPHLHTLSSVWLSLFGSVYNGTAVCQQTPSLTIWGTGSMYRLRYIDEPTAGPTYVNDMVHHI